MAYAVTASFAVVDDWLWRPTQLRERRDAAPAAGSRGQLTCTHHMRNRLSALCVTAMFLRIAHGISC